jgi:16S rRNA (adenine1518-N6/adenine1519-N6)-dimethyltransferase
VIQGDILKFDLAAVPGPRPIKVFGNIPYYITSPIIEHLLCFRDMVDTIFLTVQKEFARRICASPGGKEYGSFSLYVRYFTEPEILFDVKKNSFYPVPKVDSSFIRLRVRRSPPVKVADEREMFRIIRRAFQQRRKTLRSSLKGFVPEAKLKDFLSRCPAGPNARPEELSLPDFAALAPG